MKIVNQDISLADEHSGLMGDMFTGEVMMQNLISEGDAPALRVTSVTFVDGCRNTWHTHTSEQVLIITEGIGVVANDDGEREVRPGDVILVHPLERHWHGAKDGHDMTHLSILLPGEMDIETSQ